MKIDKRKTYYCILDVETCPIIPSKECDPNNMLVYDIGYLIADKMGNIYIKKSYIVSEIFFGETQKMNTAYYKDKIPNYLIDIGQNKRQVRGLKEIKWLLEKDMQKYNCNIICAFNGYFDYMALKNTMEYLRYGKYFYSYDVILWDIMKMAKTTFYKNKTYEMFCKENNYYTKNNLKRCTAEILYQYMNNDLYFNESHTGLEDCLIEYEIMLKAMSHHKAMTKLLFNKKE